MAIATLVAGAYNATWNAISLGDAPSNGTTGQALTSEGYTLTQDMKGELIQNSDQYGDSIIDGIYRGGNCFVDCESKTFIAGTTVPFWPYGGGVLGQMVNGATNPIGVQLSAVAKALVLTANTATPARGTTPSINTLTGTLAVLPPDSNLKLLFTSKLRTVPLRWLLLPSNAAGVITWFICA